MDSTEQRIGSPEDVRRWAENRRVANVLKARDLVEYWGEPERSVQAALDQLGSKVLERR